MVKLQLKEDLRLMVNFKNLRTESLIAQRHIHGHMRSCDLQTHDLDIARELLLCQFYKKTLFLEPKREIVRKRKLF